MAEDPQTWTELKSDLAAWMIRDDLATVIPKAIAFAERGFQKSVFCPEREVTATLSFTGESASLPSDFWGVKTAYLDGNPKRLLDQVTVNTLRETYAYSSTGTPRDFAIEGENMLLGPVPSTADVKLTYWQTIPALDGSTATNWLLTDHPELYMAASLAWLNRYARDPQEASGWANAAGAMIEQINKSGSRRKNNSGPIAARASVGDKILSFIR